MAKTSELVKAVYLSDQHQDLLIKGQNMRRLNAGSGRYYVNSDKEAFCSSTTFVDAVLPQSKHLDSWRMKMLQHLGSQQKVEEFVMSTADYGTLLHIAVGEFCKSRSVDLFNLEGWFFSEFHNVLKFPKAVAIAATDDILKDYLAILQFFHDYNCTVIAVELPVYFRTAEVLGEHTINPFGGIATQIDFVVSMRKTPKSKEYINVLVNLKSGKSGFHDSHLYQLCAERSAYNARFGEVLAIDEVANLAPSNWRTKPSYKFKLRTKEADAVNNKYLNYLSIADQDGILAPPSKSFLQWQGSLSWGDNPTEAINRVTFEDLVDSLEVEEEKQAPNLSEDLPF